MSREPTSVECPHCGGIIPHDEIRITGTFGPSAEAAGKCVKCRSYVLYEGFRAACENATYAYVRPYGLYHNGEVYWDPKLPRKKGSVVRYFEDTTGPCTSLVVLTLDGEYLTNAYPASWHEDDHPSQHEMRRWWASLTQEERDEITRDVE